jgi:hypothetical protein
MDDHCAAPEPFDAADTAFRLLYAGPQPLALHAARVAADLPDRPVPLVELRVLLPEEAPCHDTHPRRGR